MTSDVIIVGNGIIGSATAFSFLEAGYKVSLVAPYETSGQSATLAAGAMLGVVGEVSHDELDYPDRRNFEFRLLSAKMYGGFLERLNSRTGQAIRTRKGTFIVATNVGHEDVKNINAMKRLADEYAIASEWIEPEDIAWYHPNSGNIARKALFLRDEEFISSGLILSSIHKAIQSFPNVRVIREDCRRVIVENDVADGIILGNGERLASAHVVLCAGFGIANILSESNLSEGTIPLILGGKGTSLIIDGHLQNAPLNHVFRTPNRDFACGTHVVPLPDGRIYIGATNRLVSSDKDKISPSPGELHALTHSAIHEINTYIRSGNLLSLNCGVRPFTSDGKPLLGLSDIKGLSFATGTYRNGILLAPLMSDIVLKEFEAGETVADNPYSAKKQSRPRQKDKSKIITDGIKHLISFVQDPHGRLPYHREKELEKVMSLLVKASFLKDRAAIKVIDELTHLLNNYEIQEIIPEIFYKMQKDIAPAEK